MGLLRHLTRLPYFRGLWERFPFGPLDLRVRFGIFREYGPYMYGVFHSALLAAALGVDRVSAVELGVAGGRGLLALERIAEEVEEFTGVGVDVVGFDLGEGMPEPSDYRDLAHVWTTGFYRMDEARLRERLTRAELVLGDVGETLPAWLESDGTAPLGFVAFDLDYYSSTARALRVFEAGHEKYLPRVHCYLDDIVGPEFACMSEFVGELAAIRDFNERHATRKISRIENLHVGRAYPERWLAQIYAFHDFEHPSYMKNIMPDGPSNRQMALPEAHRIPQALMGPSKRRANPGRVGSSATG